MMTSHDSSGTEKIALREGQSLFAFMGFRLKKPVDYRGSPQPSKVLYACREEGKAAHPLQKHTLLLGLLLMLFYLS